ncbi:MAG: arylesterase [Advenella sp.]|uniref:arylesterase n=1 Tax=Advenella sp. S44 TaxID=1982755 RepID=UPI001F5B8B2A|nr:arylesterase [Advenella sp. S44]
MTTSASMIRVLSILISLWVFVGPQLAQAQEKAVSPKTPVILVVGDSLSAEYGIRRGAGWVQWLIENKKEALDDARLVNASISGDTTAGGRSRLPALLEKHQPDIMILELGANDALRGLSLDASRDNLKSMIDAAQERNAKVVLIGMQIPPNFGPDYARQFEQMFGTLAKEKDTYLVPFLFSSFALDRNMYQDDGIHPAEQAQPLMAQTVWPVLEKALTDYRQSR